MTEYLKETFRTQTAQKNIHGRDNAHAAVTAQSEKPWKSLAVGAVTTGVEVFCSY